MILNKKLWWSTSALVPLIIAPVALVASCSSTPSVDQASHDEQANFALSASKYVLQSKASLYGLQKASEAVFDANNNPLFTLKPSINFGFTTEISGAKGEKADDKKGEKTITITVRKRVYTGMDQENKPTFKEIEKTEKLTLKGFLTTEQAVNETNANNKKLKISEIVNLNKIAPTTSTVVDQSQPNLVVRKATVFIKEPKNVANAPEYNDANINEFMKALNESNDEVLKKYLDVGFGDTMIKDDQDPSSPGFGYQFLIKSDKGLTKENFKWTNVHKTKNGNIISPSVSADLQLVDGDKTSGVVQVEFVGWKLANGYKNQVRPLIESMVQDFGTLYNPIVNNEAVAKLYTEEAAKSENFATIWTSDAGGILLNDWDKVGGDLIMPLKMEAKLVGSQVVGFDQERGSVTIKLSLKRSDPNAVVEKDTIFEKELTIYGFQVGPKPAAPSL